MLQAYESLGALQAVTDHPTMWVGLGLLKEKAACEPSISRAKKQRLLSQVQELTIIVTVMLLLVWLF